MIIKIGQPHDIRSSEITPEPVYRSRREFLQLTAAGAVGAMACGPLGEDLSSPLSTTEKPHTWDQLTTYNNFYEFGQNKSDPAANAHRLTVKPWTVKVDGLVAKPADYALEDLVKPHQLEERIYRFRCVEAWSAVIPWVGFPLAELIKRVQPNSRAKYVAFTTLLRPNEMPGQRGASLDWPYVEGLRMDEAMNPLTILATGLYGKEMPKQNGAPIRLVVPWKYGFKSIKSIVKISFVEQQPPTSWNIANAREYGFYSNVNPNVDHPRWSQARENSLGSFLKNKQTLMFNGYADQVAKMYEGMDLKKFY